MSEASPDLLRAAAAKCGCPDGTLSRFTEHLLGLPAHKAARINPFTFAEEAGVPSETAVDMFVHGAKFGVFDLEWGMVCPLCGAITHSVPELDRVADDIVFCAMCMRDAPSVLDDTVEVSFVHVPAASALDVHGDLASYLQYYRSSSYPYGPDWDAFIERQTKDDAKLEPGASDTLTATIGKGDMFRLLCMDTHSGVDIQVADDGAAAPSSATIRLSEAGFEPTRVRLAPGEVTITVENQAEQPVWCRLILIDMDGVRAIISKGEAVFGPRLTGKHLLNNQAFRDTFALSELAPDLKLKLRNLTLLFTDLKGSTALYDREGDLAAYRLVQDHFVALKGVVKSNSGAMIKTMGDAVMAAFPSGRDGVSAAIEMMAAMKTLAGGRRDNDVGLKVGLHAGPALAINAGRSVDYFGQTVNIAARVQGLADAGDICVTRALNDEEAVTDVLERAGYGAKSEIARLKGVSADEQIFRYSAGA